jgi:hypothetical protein
VVFHIGILVHLELGWFSAAMLCWYPLLMSWRQTSRFARPGGLPPRVPRIIFPPAGLDEIPEPFKMSLLG